MAYTTKNEKISDILEKSKKYITLPFIRGKEKEILKMLYQRIKDTPIYKEKVREGTYDDFLYFLPKEEHMHLVLAISFSKPSFKVEKDTLIFNEGTIMHIGSVTSFPTKYLHNKIIGLNENLDVIGLGHILGIKEAKFIYEKDNKYVTPILSYYIGWEVNKKENEEIKYGMISPAKNRIVIYENKEYIVGDITGSVMLAIGEKILEEIYKNEDSLHIGVVYIPYKNPRIIKEKLQEFYKAVLNSNTKTNILALGVKYTEDLKRYIYKESLKIDQKEIGKLLSLYVKNGFSKTETSEVDRVVDIIEYALLQTWKYHKIMK